MITTNIELEQLRTFSVLSETPQFVDDGKNKYVTYAGYLFPYSAFSTIFMWALCGPLIYHHIWVENLDIINQVKALNPHDLELQTLDKSAVGAHLTNKIKLAMGETTPETVENLITTMFYSSTTMT